MERNAHAPRATPAILEMDAGGAGGGGRAARLPSGSSAVTVLADDAATPDAGPDAVVVVTEDADGEGDGEGGEADPEEEKAELERALRAVGDADAPDGAESPLPPYVRHRGGTVREEPAVAVDLSKKVKVKDGAGAPNTFAAKKTVAQGMMDIALITSNANQLRYLFEFAKESDFFHLNVVLIVISLFLQIAVGVSLIFKGRADLSVKDKKAHANRLNNYVVGGVFLVTIINVFLAAFSVSNNNNKQQLAAVTPQPPPSG